MGPVALVYMPGFFFPSESGAPETSPPIEIPMRIPGAREPVPLGATLATGTQPTAHGVDGPYVFDRDPIRLRTRSFNDVSSPWIWDLVQEAGRSCVVIGWPGIIQAEGSPTPMICSAALYGTPIDDGTWPLPTPWVSSPDIRNAVAGARIASGTVDTDALFDVLPAEDLEAEVSERGAAALQRMIAGVKSGLGMLELFGPSGLDLAVLNFQLSLNQQVSPALRSLLLDLILREIRGTMGQETTILVIGRRAHRTALQINPPAGGVPEVIVDGPACSVLDVAPTLLGMLEVPAPSHLTGRSLLAPLSVSGPKFELTESVPESRSDIEELVDVLVGDEGKSLPEKSRAHLQRYALTHLRRQHRSSLARVDYGSALKQARLLARLNPGPLPLWHIAFAANRSGDMELVLETSRTLLGEHAGTPHALLSVFLCSAPTGSEETRVILDSINPSQLVAPSMRSVWGRKALAHDRVDDGIEILSSLQKRGRAIPIDLLMLATALIGREEPDRALSVLGPLGQSVNAPLKAKVIRANVLLAAGHHAEARRQAQLILQHTPHHPRAVEILRRTDPAAG